MLVMAPEGVKVLSVTASVSQIAEYRKARRDPPSDLIHQHKEVNHRLQWQKAQLERGSPALLSGNSHTQNTHEYVHYQHVSGCLNLSST